MPGDSTVTLAAHSSARPTHLQQGPTAHTTYRLIQVLRAVAAEMVVLRHATTLLNVRDSKHFSVWFNGVNGVDIFFVISGFVMMISTTPLLDTLHPSRTFLARRLERIVPMYWLATTVKVLALLAVPTLALTGLGRWWHVLASYLFLPTRAPAGYGTVLSVGWTLVFEMAFYILFAVVLATRLPRLLTLAPVLIVLAFASEIPFVTRHGTLHFYANTRQLEFLFGILLAASIPWVRRIPAPLAILFAVAGFLPLLLSNLPTAFVAYGGIFNGIPALAVVTAAVALESPLGHRMPKWLLEIGDASYSIYLVHAFILPLVCIPFARYGGRGPLVLPLALIVSLIAATLAGDLAYRLIERPTMQWFKGRRRSAIPANAR
jgi:exopolysaccharide production protein ExoZ